MSLKNFQKNMAAIRSALGLGSKDEIAALGATRIKAVSERTVCIELETPRADGTNQIKVTVHEDGTFTLKGHKRVETDLIYGVVTDGLALALKNLGTVA
jgi:hypothetical protein